MTILGLDPDRFVAAVGMVLVLLTLAWFYVPRPSNARGRILDAPATARTGGLAGQILFNGVHYDYDRYGTPSESEEQRASDNYDDRMARFYTRQQEDADRLAYGLTRRTLPLGNYGPDRVEEIPEDDDL